MALQFTVLAPMKLLSQEKSLDNTAPRLLEYLATKGAINMYRREEVQTLLYGPMISSSGTKRNILIFHCEFSSERGPKLNRFLRNQDRELHKRDYPQLTYPEVYLMEGGYKTFYDSHKDLCDPCGYKPMLHKDHATDLRHFRVKSKSWTAGERLHPNRLAL